MVITCFFPIGLLLVTARSITGLSLCLFFIAVSIGLGCQDRFVNAETSQQISCVLSELASSDAGFLSKCFLGYPTRTYYLAGLPSLLFGRSIAALNIGQHLITYSGIAAFTLGVGCIHKGITGAIIVIFATLLAFSSYHAPHLLLSFEQSSIPLSLALQFTGFLLLFLTTSQVEFLALATVSAIFAAFSYTPALSLTAIAAIFLILVVIERRNSWHWIFAMCVIVSGSTAVLSRHDHSLTSKGIVASDALNAPEQIISLLSISWDNPLVNPGVLFALLILNAIVVVNRFKDSHKREQTNQEESVALFTRYPLGVLFLLIVWTLLTVAASIGLHGYASPPPSLAVHRASLVFPVLSGVVIWLAFHNRKPGAIMLCLLLVHIGILSWKIVGRVSDEFATRTFPPAPFRVMEVADEATASNFFQVAAPPAVFFEWPGDGIVNGNDYNTYFGIVSDYKGINTCSEIPSDKIPALIVLNRITSKCSRPQISHCIPLFFLTSRDLELCQLVTSNPPSGG